MCDQLTIKTLVQESGQGAHNRGWHDKPRSFGDLIALCHSELSEALESYRVIPDVQRSWLHDGKPEGVPSELADVLIRIADMCWELDIDLEAALIEKLAFNQSRSYRHGSKAL